MIAVIPAKGTSKRVPQKNLRPFCGLPLFVWSVRAAQEAGIERVVVSTESELVARHATEEGAVVVYRPEALAKDPAEAPDVALHAVAVCEEWGWRFDSVVMLLPTSPLRRGWHVRDAVALHKMHGRNVLSVVPAPEIERKLHRLVNGVLEPERLQERVLLNGAIWIATKERLRADGYFSGEDALPYVMRADHGIDIDTPADFAAAEWAARDLRL